MKITPKTDAQIAEEGLWPKGEYDFEFVSAEDKVSQKGNDMIKVVLKCYHNNSTRTVTDYLMEKMAFKLRHCCYAVGLGAAYESGEFTAEQFVGRSGKVQLRQEKQEGYMPKMVVDDYVVEESDKPVRSNSVAHVTKGASPDEPPF